LRYSRRKLSGWVLRIALTCSLVAVCVLAAAGQYTDLDRRLAPVEDSAQASKLIQPVQDADPAFRKLAEDLRDPGASDRKLALTTLKQYVSARARAESYAEDSLAKAQAIAIKKSPLYKDDQLQSSNWFGKAAENLIRMIKGWFNFKMPKSEGPNLKFGELGAWFVYVMWGVLFALVAVFAYLAIRHARWRFNLKRKAKAILEEDEPERTLDEWLERANLLEAEGRYREAIRCLYLACLLKFDEARVARFERGQTNWEHLHRIQASPKLPPDLDFQPTTESFDRIWYGMKTSGKPDVDRFRDWYLEISRKVMLKAA
jgi:hypothetical protein